MYGLSPQEFVKQVYYVQEKVLLDFYPDDDKYKEVLYEANLVLQELQKEEDWGWLRQRLDLGDTNMHHPDDIPEYEFPDFVYKPCTLFNDCVTLHKKLDHDHFDERDYIRVPYLSGGNIRAKTREEYLLSMINVDTYPLGAIVYGNTLTFNRPLTIFEQRREAVCDVIRRIPRLHICDENCVDVDGNEPNYDPDAGPVKPCTKIEKDILVDVPDPNYVIIRTACLHAEGSPVAQGRIAGLQDQAQKLLSAMRENNAAYTNTDTITWNNFSYMNII